MSELTYTVLRLGLLVLLWVLVLAVVGVLRRDLFGTRVVARPSRDDGRRGPAAPPREERAREERAREERAREERAREERAREERGRREDRTLPRQVVVVEGPLRGTSLALGSAPVVIGRAPDSTLVLDDDYASGRHARLFPRDGRWWVEDLGSTNGTLLGREPLGGAAPVQAGARLSIGRTVLELRR